MRSDRWISSESLFRGLGLALAFTLFGAGVTSANDDSEFGRAGGYVSFGVGGGREAFTGILDLGGSGIDLGTAFFIGGRVGARVNKYVALEAAADYSIDGLTLQVPGVGSAEAKTLVATGNLKLYPGDWRIQPFAMGGLGLLYATTDCTTSGGATFDCSNVGVSESATAFAGRVGAGLDVYITRNIAVTGEVTYVIPSGELADFNFVTFGGQVLFRF